MGLKLMPLPEEPFINFAGMLSEQERLQALEAATVVVCPSPYESLSLIALEALAVGTPLLCNARSDVLVDHCLRSNGGLFYRDRDEFVECMKLSWSTIDSEPRWGDRAASTCDRNYRWDVVLGKLDRMIAKLDRDSDRRNEKRKSEKRIEIVSTQSLFDRRFAFFVTPQTSLRNCHSLADPLAMFVLHS